MYRKRLYKIISLVLSLQPKIIVLVVMLLSHDKTVRNAFATRIQLDGFAAIVNGKVILESDISFEISLMDIENKPEKKELFDRKEVLEKLIDRDLLLDQARRFTLKTISVKELNERINRMDNVFGGAEGRERFLKQNGIDELFWRIYIHNRMILENYIEQRFRTFARVTREQEDQFILNHIEELELAPEMEPGKAVPEDHHLRKIIRVLLSERIVQERINEFLKELRSSAIIVYSQDEHGLLADETLMVDD